MYLEIEREGVEKEREIRGKLQDKDSSYWSNEFNSSFQTRILRWSGFQTGSKMAWILPILDMEL